jgi:hypothetical protein
MDSLPKRKVELAVFGSLEEAARADAEFYARLTGEERLGILFEILEQHRDSADEQRLERVYRLTQRTCR